MDRSRIDRHMLSALEFVRGLPEFHLEWLQPEHVRFLVTLQHFLMEDTADIYRPPGERKHADTFEGVLTDASVNSQLVKDAHRSEWSVDGRSFSMQEPSRQGASTLPDGEQDRKHIIKNFQRELVSALEQFLLDFAS